jgi:hypothetical protein
VSGNTKHSSKFDIAMQYLIYPIAIYVLLIVIRYFILFLLLCKSQIQYPKYQITKADTVPIYLKDLFQLNPKEAEAYILRSQIRRHLGDNQGAIADEQTGNTLFKAMDEEDPT